MSTFSTILDTDKEHWVTDCTSEKHGDEWIQNVLTIHIDKSNVLRFEEDADSYVIDIRPGTDLYRQLVTKLGSLTELNIDAPGVHQALWDVSKGKRFDP